MAHVLTNLYFALTPGPSPTGEGSESQVPLHLGEGFRVRARCEVELINWRFRALATFPQYFSPIRITADQLSFAQAPQASPWIAAAEVRVTGQAPAIGSLTLDPPAPDHTASIRQPAHRSAVFSPETERRRKSAYMRPYEPLR